MSALLEQCFQSVDETRDAILARWKRLTDIDSGSSDKAGVDAVSRLVEDELRTLGFSVRIVDYEKAGRLLIADFGDEKRPPILLVGHLDTVFNLNFSHCLRPVFFKGQYPLSYAMVGVIPKNGRKGPLPRAQHPVWADSNSAMAIR